MAGCCRKHIESCKKKTNFTSKLEEKEVGGKKQSKTIQGAICSTIRNFN
jgi:hypothetical protein